MSRFTRTFGVLTVLLAAFAIIAVTAGAKSSSKGKSDSGKIYTAITHTAGGYEYAAGSGTDKVSGAEAVTYKIKAGSTKSGITLTIPSIVIYTATGELSGTGTAKLAIVGTTETVSDGKFDLTKGTGGQKGHSESGTFSGSGSTATSQYVFTTKGTYK
jgi:hypothetical protein